MSNETTQPETPMPMYQCHKKVGALKIKNLLINKGFDPHSDADQVPQYRLEFEGGEFAPIHVSAYFVSTHNPKAGDYFVQYADDYRSISPAKAFEEGYAPIDKDNFESRLLAELAELDIKISKLGKFLDGDVDELSAEHQTLLVGQFTHMSSYARTLHQRLELLGITPA